MYWGFVVKNTLQKKVFVFLPCISISPQENSTRPRVIAHPVHAILFNTVPIDWQMGKAAHEESGLWHGNLLLSCKVAYPHSVVVSAYYIYLLENFAPARIYSL